MSRITRSGIGYDVHRLEQGEPGRSLVLGGVDFHHPQGLTLSGHSDADVLCHAIADALLGAAGLQDIGHYFPNTDPSIRGISSLEILRRVVKATTNECLGFLGRGEGIAALATASVETSAE